MVMREAEMDFQGELESQLQNEEELNKNHSFSSLGRQSSIYSLTLDEFQHSLCESGKNFGSMNMDEFLSSIWNAQENQTINSSNTNNLSLTQTSTEKGIRKQPSLPRQGSLSIPAPLCSKTVEEVWSEIHKEQQQHQSNNNTNTNNNNVVQNTEFATTPRQPTFGEMTLEDFLVKAGVVREQCAMQTAPASQQHYGVYSTSNNSTMASSFVGGHVIGEGNVVAPPYQAVAQGGGAVGDISGKRDGSSGYAQPSGVCFGGRVVNGGGGGGGVYGVAQTIGMASPDHGIGNENSGGQFGVEMDGLRGRKRMVDGPVEKVVERRQRRMIKNRESAARSRARKQAYTVELEAELNQLREENAQLKQALVELERRRKQQCFEEVNVRVQTKAHKAKEKLRVLRRNLSCPL
ncbi:protein ABSCISIC ACID-INSENSITIVE 5-like [Gastrolobium bilobum]|uniref:protein ABSCISIC ACID-INSENSITIVE 5-like n=1 Tax=Gastrolobium bilobum TaxID=150636 RepID=UPI002AB14D51|nr:protein ABSCISIC ACID-INSENSITIVE 5-like [Gastrolobium bilobum]